MSWNEIAHVTFSKITSALVITDHRSQKLRISIYLNGYKEFIKIVASHVPYEIHNNSIFTAIEQQEVFELIKGRKNS